MNKVVGFAHISNTATTCRGAENPSEFIGKVCRVLEFAVDGGVLVINNESTALATVDKEDVIRQFKCGYSNGVITPPDLDFISEAAYLYKVTHRKGGYSPILAQMIIQIGLGLGKFSDAVLWQKQ